MRRVRILLIAAIAILAAVPSATLASAVGHSAGATAPVAPLANSLEVAPESGSASWSTYMYDVERTGANTLEHTIGVGNVATLEPIWSVPSNGSDFSAPVVVNGTVYYGSWNGDEYAVNASTGTVLWQTYLGTDNTCGYVPMGISSTPAYANGTLYLGGGDGYWYALNASTGAIDWSFLPGSLTENYYDWASALVYGSSLYIGTSSCFDNPLVPAGLIEVSLTGSHHVIAQFNTTPPGEIGESIWSTPALDPATNTIWVSTGNENPPGYPPYANAIIGVNATTLQPLGSWQVPNVEGQDSDFGSTPVLFHTASGTPMVVASNKNGIAYALDRRNVSVNGTWGPVWNISTGGGFSGGAFDGSTVYLAGGSVYAVNPANGTPLWNAPMAGGGYITGSLSWANGLVYAGGGSEVEAIDAANGSVLWNASLAPGQSTVTEPVVEDGMVFVASGDYGSSGEMTAYGLQPWTVTFQVSGTPPAKGWSASLGGLSTSSKNGTIVFYEPNGSYPYLVRGPAGTVVAGGAPSGTVSVAGKNVTVDVSFARGRTTSVSFHEHGLPSRTPWCVTLSGWKDCPIRSGVTLRNLTPASYPYAVAGVTGFAATVRLDGAAAGLTGVVDALTHSGTIAVAYARLLYSVTFNETGLPPGTVWSVRLVTSSGGHRSTSTHRTMGSSLALSLRNGTYSYTARAGKAYASLTGTLNVSGAAVTVNLTFAAAGSPVRLPGSETAVGTLQSSGPGSLGIRVTPRPWALP